MSDNVSDNVSGERGLFLILSGQKIFCYFMHMRGETVCEFTAKNYSHGSFSRFSLQKTSNVFGCASLR